VGTALSVVSVSLLALNSTGALLNEASLAAAAVAVLQALSSALMMNIAIVGINQCYDVDIDKVGQVSSGDAVEPDRSPRCTSKTASRGPPGSLTASAHEVFRTSATAITCKRAGLAWRPGSKRSTAGASVPSCCRHV
jgi:hypothetical protein